MEPPQWTPPLETSVSTGHATGVRTGAEMLCMIWTERTRGTGLWLYTVRPTATRLLLSAVAALHRCGSLVHKKCASVNSQRERHGAGG